MTYFLDPFGCAKNQVDAENILASLNAAGWAAADNGENADLIIINSCGFIESAKQESINAVLLWRRLCPEKKILLAGCLSQRYAKELKLSLPEADGFFGNSDLNGIVETAAALVNKQSAKLADAKLAGAKPKGANSSGSRPLLSLPGSAYVKISEGCDNRCSYCAIPLIRGGLKSRPLQDLLEECKTLLGRGIKELCLVGQDLGSYGRDLTANSAGLYGLLEALSGLKGDFWVRLLYIHPDNFPMNILDIIKRDKRFLPYFDIPFQHGSEKILKNMNRRGNAKAYLELINVIRKRLPDAVIRSTFMCGFPGETGEDFSALVDFQEKAALDWLGCFVYSREEDTPAYNMKGRVPKKIAAERKRLVEEKQIPITEKQMERFVGRTFDVLIEEKLEAPETGEGTIYLGRLFCHAPEIDGSAVIDMPGEMSLGTIVPCRLTGRAGFDLQVQVLLPQD